MNYFDEETDKFIAKYLKTEEEKEKHLIFNNNIRPAFEKLIENLIYVYGFFNIDDVEMLKKDCLANLYELIPKWKPENGTKGFSYFNMIARNWFFMKKREFSKRKKIEGEYHRNLESEYISNESSFAIDSHEKQSENTEFWLELNKEFDNWRPKLSKKAEKKVLEAIIFLMKNSDLIQIYNKKAIYLYVRDLTGLNSKQVVINLKKIRKLFEQWKNRYYDDKLDEDIKE